MLPKMAAWPQNVKIHGEKGMKKTNTRKVSIRDVAKEVGGSITTVSRALNGYSDVSQKTKEKIFEAVERLDYAPDANARSMGGKAEINIALLTSELKARDENGFVYSFINGLYQHSKYHYLAWKELADELGIPFDEAYNEKLKGVSRMEGLELVLACGGACDSYTIQEKEKLAEKKNDIYKELIKQISSSDILPGIAQFLEELKGHQIKAALTSVSKNAPFILGQLGLDTAFDYVADASAVPNAKPFPDIFLAGMHEFGCDCTECIGVEDAKTGIEAIHRAGMKAVGVGTPSEMAEAELIVSTDELTLELILEKLQMIV